MARYKKFEDLKKETDNKLRELIRCAEKASKKLHYLADEIDEHFRNCNKGKIAGAAASLAGFPLMAVGFGLSFVTFGASLGLSIAGAALSGAGGITAAGSGLAEHFITKDKCREAQEAVNAVRTKAKAYKEDVERMLKMVPSTDCCSDVLETGNFLKNVVGGVVSPVLSGIKLAGGVADDAAATVFRGLGTGSRFLHIGGFAFSALLVPYDIYILATSSAKEHRKTGSEQASEIRDLARKMHRFAQEGKACLDQQIH